MEISCVALRKDDTWGERVMGFAVDQLSEILVAACRPLSTHLKHPQTRITLTLQRNQRPSPSTRPPLVHAANREPARVSNGNLRRQYDYHTWKNGATMSDGLANSRKQMSGSTAASHEVGART